MDARCIQYEKLHEIKDKAVSYTHLDVYKRQFRIYAGKDNRPADYSPDNVPYHPEDGAPISLDGYREGSFCMTMGYPGSTERYLSSFGIEEMMTTTPDERSLSATLWLFCTEPTAD